MFQVGDTVIGTHFIDLSTISNDGKTGKTHLNKNLQFDKVGTTSTKQKRHTHPTKILLQS